MKALLVLSCLVGVSRAIGGGGCPLNYGDSCGWTETADGSLCYKPIFHGKSLYDAAELCWALGNYECPSELMYSDEAPKIMEEADPMDLPQFVRTNAKAFCYDCDWYNTLEGPPFFPGPPYTPNIYTPYNLPEEYEDNHIISAVWEVAENLMTGHTPAQDRVSFVCTSCVTMEHSCPVICEYCIPHPPMDGMWTGWESWGACTGTCMYGTQERTRFCNPPMWDGEDCQGDDTQYRGCETYLSNPCPVESEWTPWSSWNSCTSSADGCGPGAQSKTRACLGQVGSCEGLSSKSRSCDAGDDDCVVVPPPPPPPPVPSAGSWCSWGYWSDCDQSCGLGVSVKARSCQCPPPFNGGAECDGDELQERPCKDAPCPILQGVWESWGDWAGSCIVDCGSSDDVRTRSCMAAGLEVANCMGDRAEWRPCALDQAACDSSLVAMTFSAQFINIGIGPKGYMGDIMGVCSTLSLVTYQMQSPMAFRYGRDIMVCGGETTPYMTPEGPTPYARNIPHKECWISDVANGAGLNPGPNMLEPRVGSAYAQLTPYSVMVIGGGPETDVGCTTEFLFGQDRSAVPTDFVRGPDVPGVRSMHGACAVALDSDTVLVTGGRVDGVPSRMVLKYSISMGEWTRMADMLVAHTYHHCMKYQDTVVVTMGDTKTTATGIYDLMADSWTFGAPSPVALEDSISYEEADKLFITGGYFPGDGSFQTPNQIIYEYDPSGDAWLELADETAANVYKGSTVMVEASIKDEIMSCE